MIDEKKLIEELIKACAHNAGGLYDTEMLEIVNKMPKVGEWIPVSERLPEINSEIIGSSAECVYMPIYYGYPDGSKDKPCFYAWDDEMWNCFKFDIIAWMPLPEPYKGDEE